MYDDTKLQVYDLGGAANFRSVWQHFFAEISGFVYVVDASDPGRFDESCATLDEMVRHPMMRGKPHILVANKQDKEGAVPAVTLKRQFKLDHKVRVLDAVVTQPDNKKCNAGVSVAVSTLIKAIIAKYETLAQKRDSDLQGQKCIDEAEAAEKRARIERRREEQETAAMSQQ
jgi:ADP-ribosylation factor-like protein 13B